MGYVAADTGWQHQLLSETNSKLPRNQPSQRQVII